MIDMIECDTKEKKDGNQENHLEEKCKYEIQNSIAI